MKISVDLETDGFVVPTSVIFWRGEDLIKVPLRDLQYEQMVELVATWQKKVWEVYESTAADKRTLW